MRGASACRAGWLDAARQVPPARDGDLDSGLDFEAVAARHTALLDAYPELSAFYLSAPD